MLIWDTGEYDVLPFEQEVDERMTDDEGSQNDSEDDGAFRSGGTSDLGLSQCEKLETAFRNGEIRLRLHGTRLPKDYTITLRVSRNEGPAARKPVIVHRSSTQTIVKRSMVDTAGDQANIVDFDEDNLNEDADTTANIRSQNAYIGAVNTIGSIHQRWWFLAMDKVNCGFVKGKTKEGKVSWTPGNQETQNNYPFFVRGRDVETSIVTERKAADVLRDEGVTSFVPRGGWKPALT